MPFATSELVPEQARPGVLEPKRPGRSLTITWRDNVMSPVRATSGACWTQSNLGRIVEVLLTVQLLHAGSAGRSPQRNCDTVELPCHGACPSVGARHDPGRRAG